MWTRDLRITLCRTCAVRASERAKAMVAGVERVRCNEAADFVRTNLTYFLFIQQFIKLLKLKKKNTE